MSNQVSLSITSVRSIICPAIVICSSQFVHSVGNADLALVLQECRICILQQDKQLDMWMTISACCVLYNGKSMQLKVNASYSQTIPIQLVTYLSNQYHFHNTLQPFYNHYQPIQTMKKQQNKPSYANRQADEYQQLMEDFENIIAEFSKILALKTQYDSINQSQIQQEWQEYLQQLARDKNMLKQTMSLFKLQFVKEHHQQNCYIDIELQNCMRDMEERESRIDAKIKEKKQELQEQRKRDKINQQPQRRNRLTEEQIKKEQEEYHKFVAQYMADIERKRAEEAQARLRREPKQPAVSAFDPKLKLQMPKLNEQQRKLIGCSSAQQILNNKSGVSSINANKSIQSSYNDQTEYNHIEAQLNAMLSQIEFQVSPLQKSLQNLIEKVDRIEETALSHIKSNQQRIKRQTEINLEEVVKTSCRTMLSKLNQQIKSQLEVSVKKLYSFQEQSVKHYQQSIDKFKEYAKLQVKHRITMFHQNRRRLEQTAQQIARKQKYQLPRASK